MAQCARMNLRVGTRFTRRPSLSILTRLAMLIVARPSAVVSLMESLNKLSPILNPALYES